MKRVLATLLFFLIGVTASISQVADSAWPSAGGGGAASNYEWFPFSADSATWGAGGTVWFQARNVQFAVQTGGSADTTWHAVAVPSGSSLTITDVLCVSTTTSVLGGGTGGYIYPAVRKYATATPEGFFGSPGTLTYTPGDGTQGQVKEARDVSVTVSTTGPQLLQLLGYVSYGNPTWPDFNCVVRAGW